MTFFAFWNSEAEPKAGWSVICMYLLVGWAICVAVDQFLSLHVILWCSKLRSTRWGLESYSSHPLGIQEAIRVGPLVSFQSQLHLWTFVGLLGSLFFSSYEKRCWVSAEWRNMKSGGQNHKPRLLQVLQNSHGSP